MSEKLTCGNCENWKFEYLKETYRVGKCKIYISDMATVDYCKHCHLTPSRWQRRKE